MAKPSVEELTKMRELVALYVAALAPELKEQILLLDQRIATLSKLEGALRTDEDTAEIIRKADEYAAGVKAQAETARAEADAAKSDYESKRSDLKVQQERLKQDQVALRDADKKLRDERSKFEQDKLAFARERSEWSAKNDKENQRLAEWARNLSREAQDYEARRRRLADAAAAA